MTDSRPAGIDVTTLGAKPGEDITAALQAAFDARPAGGTTRPAAGGYTLLGPVIFLDARPAAAPPLFA